MAEEYDVFEVAEKVEVPEKPAVKSRQAVKVDPETAEAEAAGLTREELLAVREAQHRLWPLGQ